MRSIKNLGPQVRVAAETEHAMVMVLARHLVRNRLGENQIVSHIQPHLSAQT